MSQTRVLSGNVLGASGWMRGRIAFGERIESLEGDAVDPATNQDVLVVPGFIDLHVHGGGGADVMDGGDAVQRIAKVHGRYGTTAFLATTMTAPHDALRSVLGALPTASSARPSGGARLLGVHLEGPFINGGKLGAQPDFARPASADELDELCRLAPVRVVTLAPEIEGHLDIVERLARRGVRVQIGHTLSSYDDCVAALARGARGFTHLFNAMTALHHRSPGAVGAALAHAEYAELIPDLEHVQPGAIRAALRAIPHLYCVTDSTAAAGMPDGEYRLGAHRVRKCHGGVRLADGTLAGSALTMDRAFRNLVSLGLSLEDASRRLSQFPAAYLGVSDRGRLFEGAVADLVVLDRALNVVSVFAEGELLWSR